MNAAISSLATRPFFTTLPPHWQPSLTLRISVYLYLDDFSHYFSCYAFFPHYTSSTLKAKFKSSYECLSVWRHRCVYIYFCYLVMSWERAVFRCLNQPKPDTPFLKKERRHDCVLIAYSLTVVKFKRRSKTSRNYSLPSPQCSQNRVIHQHVAKAHVVMYTSITFADGGLAATANSAPIGGAYLLI